MGVTQSRSTPRTTAFENPDKVIEITDDVVQRIRGHQMKNATRTTSQNIDNGSSKTTDPSSVPSSYNNVSVNPSVYHGEPTITALEVRRQKEQELRNNDAYWMKRLTQQEKTLQKTNSILEREYDAALDNVRNRFRNAPPQLQLPPCREFKQKVIDCYNSHPSETLICAGLVDEFTNCVATHQAKLLDEKQKQHELQLMQAKQKNNAASTEVNPANVTPTGNKNQQPIAKTPSRSSGQ